MDIILKPKFNEEKDDFIFTNVKRKCNTAVIMVLFFIFSVTTAYAVPQFNYITIIDGDYEVNVYTEKNNVEDAILEQGISLSEHDEVTPGRNTEVYDGMNINIDRFKKVSVNYGGMNVSYYTKAQTYGEFIEENQINISVNDVISVNLGDKLDAENEFTVTKVSRKNGEITQDIPYITTKTNDSNLAKGKTKLIQKGEIGKKQINCEIIYHDGVEVSRNVVSEYVLKYPVNEVIAVGTAVPPSKKATKQTAAQTKAVAPSANNKSSTASVSEASKAPAPVQTQSPAPEQTQQVPAQAPASNPNTVTVGGTTFTYKKMINCSATAYDLSFESTGKRPGDPGYGITASGTYAKRGTVAVDPRVIPLGTKMFIVSADGNFVYGYCTAEDTGGAIKGNKVDLFYDTNAECMQFGRRNVIVYIL